MSPHQDEQAIGLDEYEQAAMFEAVADLPGLLAELAEMGHTHLTEDSARSPLTPTSRPPANLTYVAALQTIRAAVWYVVTQADEAGPTLPIVEGLQHLSHPDWAAWWMPTWWARNEVYIPIVQARHGLRRLLQYDKPIPHPDCPHCGNPVRPEDHQGEETPWLQPGFAWARCTGCNHTWTPRQLRDLTRSIPPLRMAAVARRVSVPYATLRTWARRGIISPIGEDDQGNPLYDLMAVASVAADRTT